MHIIFEFIPIIIFFTVYKLTNIYAATSALMLACLCQAGYQWVTQRKLNKNTMMVLASVLILGGATLAFHDQRFIMWKPSIVFFIFALVLFINQYSNKEPIIKSLLEENISLPEPVWRQLNLSWACFFISLAALNMVIIRYYDVNTWVNFKLFGILGLIFIFTIAQASFISTRASINNDNT